MMQILIDPGIYNCLNMGGVAMFQVAVARLRSFWPGASIAALTDDPVALARYCPGVRAVPHMHLGECLRDSYLLGRLHQRMPATFSRRLVALKIDQHRRRPWLVNAAIQLKASLDGQRGAEFRTFIQAVTQADLVVISGSSGPNDSFPVSTRQFCTMLEIAISRGTPTAVLSHGFGPLQRTDLVDRLKPILPKVDLIALRERRTAPALLEKLGVPKDRTIVTGDDAIELAYEARPARVGNGLGINLRIAAYTALDQDIVGRIRPVLQAFAAARSAPMLPVPIALHQQAPDHEAIRELLAGYDDQSDGGYSLDTPRKVIEQAGRCRVVVTGAYHAAVFALSQGVPVVCLAQSELYFNKFLGLAEQFGAGCLVVDVNQADMPERLTEALDRMWRAAEQVRSLLHDSALRQIDLSRYGYERVREIVSAYQSRANRSAQLYARV
jgi:colanic acid/amylovoran biosynthesis protein